jgi:hypothetical protein
VIVYTSLDINLFSVTAIHRRCQISLCINLSTYLSYQRCIIWIYWDEGIHFASFTNYDASILRNFLKLHLGLLTYYEYTPKLNSRRACCLSTQNFVKCRLVFSEIELVARRKGSNNLTIMSSFYALFFAKVMHKIILKKFLKMIIIVNRITAKTMLRCLFFNLIA